jgi:MFS family permease
VISYLIDYAFAGSQAWRWMFAIAVITATAFGIGLMFIPDSPRWLAARGHVDRAQAVLKQIRPAEQVQAELSNIQKSVAKQKENWSELLSPFLRPAMIVGVELAIAQQLTGINTVIYYPRLSLSLLAYWRVAWQQTWGLNYLEFGTYGIYVSSVPNGVTGVRDTYSDPSIDLAYVSAISASKGNPQ